MRRNRHLVAALVCTAVVVCLARPVSADDFWVNAARALQFAGWNTSDSGAIGVTDHLFGDGYTVWSTRQLTGWELFGGVAGFEFEPINNAVSLNTELSVRKWLIPTARLRIGTDVTGTETTAPLAYNLWVNTGIQDVQITGQGSLEAQIDINVLGFYDVDAFISNRGSFEIDGLLYADDGTLDYDLGPVSLSGNVYIDALAALTTPLFSAVGVSNPLAVFSGRAKLKNQIEERDAMVARLEAGEVLSDEQMREIIRVSVLEDIFAGGGSQLLESAVDDLASANVESVEPAFDPLAQVPEPTSAAAWLLLVGAALRRRRKS